MFNEYDEHGRRTPLHETEGFRSLPEDKQVNFVTSFLLTETRRFNELKKNLSPGDKLNVSTSIYGGIRAALNAADYIYNEIDPWYKDIIFHETYFNAISSFLEILEVQKKDVIKAEEEDLNEIIAKIDKTAHFFKNRICDFAKLKTPKKITLPAGYKPTEKEEYMNENQLEYFRQKLVSWKEELLSESNETLDHLKGESWNEPDPSDQATVVEQTSIELRTRDRYRKLINKIDGAIRRIEIGEFGYCDVTGEPIGIKRLEARPIATMTLAAQEQHEMEEKMSLEG
jgi:DnaK suppressor protein